MSYETDDEARRNQELAALLKESAVPKLKATLYQQPTLKAWA